MNTKLICALLVSLLLWMPASAITVPVQPVYNPVFGDSSISELPVAANNAVAKKKTGFFGKLKNKLESFLLQRQFGARANKSTKATLGWISLGIVVLGVGLLLFSSGGGAAGAAVLFLVGLTTGIVALVWPRSQTDKAQGKGRNTGALIGILLGIGFVAALLIAFSSWGH